MGLCCRASIADRVETPEQFALRFIANGILSHNRPMLMEMLSEDMVLLDGREFSRDKTIRSMKSFETSETDSLSIRSISFVRTDRDLQAFLEMFFHQFPGEKPGGNFRTEDGAIDLDSAWPRTWTLFRKHTPDYLKCVVIVETSRIPATGPGKLMPFFFVCRNQNGEWKVICTDDG
jgi:hypothetical protein